MMRTMQERRHQVAERAFENAGFLLIQGKKVEAYAEYMDITVRYRGTEASNKARAEIHKMQASSIWDSVHDAYREMMAGKQMGTIEKYLKLRQKEAAERSIKGLINEFPARKWRKKRRKC